MRSVGPTVLAVASQKPSPEHRAKVLRCVKYNIKLTEGDPTLLAGKHFLKIVRLIELIPPHNFIGISDTSLADLNVSKRAYVISDAG